MARRIGIALDSIPDDGVVCLAQAAIFSRNDGLLFDAEPGLLGDTLAEEGINRAVIANGDRAPPELVENGHLGEARMAALALVDHYGRVPGGDVSSELVTPDPAAPFGIAADPDAYLAAFDRAWHDRAVVLVEASDLARFDAYRGFVASTARDALQLSLLRRADDLLGALLTRVDPERDAVLVLTPAHGGGKARLMMATLRAPGVEPGLLHSGFTGRDGVVSIVDVGPTILDLFGVERPNSMEGRPFEVGDGPGTSRDRIADLIDMDEAARFRDRIRSPVLAWFVGLQIALVVAGLGAVLWFRRALPAIEFAALALLGFLPATYLARLAPFHDWSRLAYWAFLFSFAVALALLVRLATRDSVMALLCVLGVLVGVLAVDVILGSPLQFNSPFGYSPTVAGRFTGMGNVGYAQVAAGTLLIATLVAYRIPTRRGALAAVGLLAVAVVIDGAPFWGADVGGVLSMVPAFGIAATLLLGWRFRWRTALLFAGAAVALLGIFAAVDVSRGEGQSTHLGRLVDNTANGGFDSFSTVIQRKISENIAVIWSTWTMVIPIVVIALAVIVSRLPGGLSGLLERIPPLRAGLIGFGVLAVLGFALNDSGITVPGFMVGVAAPALLVLALHDERVRIVRVREPSPELPELVRT
jgi:hypothetical protein